MLNKESCLFKVGTYSGPSVNGVALMPVWGPALIGGGGGLQHGGRWGRLVHSVGQECSSGRGIWGGVGKLGEIRQ